MANPLNEKIKELRSIRGLAKRLDAIDPGVLLEARLARGLASAQVQDQARVAAAEVVKAARERAESRRSSKLKPTASLLRQQMAASHKRLLARLHDGSFRQPSAVLAQLVATARRLQSDKSVRGGSLMVRCDTVDPLAVADRLVAALGLASRDELEELGLHVRSILPAGPGRQALYAVRVPLEPPPARSRRKKKGARPQSELNNIAWALQASGSFTAVRPGGQVAVLFDAPQPGHATVANPSFSWPLALTRTDEAHALLPHKLGRALGEGIIIAHPDTGWAPHPQYNVNQIDRVGSLNVRTGERGENAARHSIRREDQGIFSVDHGTGTGSVILGSAAQGVGLTGLSERARTFTTKVDGARDYLASRKVTDANPNNALAGVAPRSLVRPIKFIEDVQFDLDETGLNGAAVVRLDDEDLVTALEYARSSGAHVVSLSIGGLMQSEVRDAIDLATENNLIIVGAAGQTYTGPGLNEMSSGLASVGVGDGDTVVLPAAFSNVIAVAGCSDDGSPWEESLRGPNVDITAPADGLWVASYESDKTGPDERAPQLEAAAGTSFAASFMAGVAALWLAHCGRDRLLELYPDKPLAWVFRHQLQRTARPQSITDWDRLNYGPGIVDVRALLARALPPSSAVRRPPATTENLWTEASRLMDSPAGHALEAAWSTLYRFGMETAADIVAVAEAGWAAVMGTTDALLKMGEQALTDLFAMASLVGAAVGAAIATAIDAVTAFVNAAAQVVADTLSAVAEAVEEAAQAAAQAVEDAAEAAARAVVDTVSAVTDAVGEAAEDAADFLFGWAS